MTTAGVTCGGFVGAGDRSGALVGFGVAGGSVTTGFGVGAGVGTGVADAGGVCGSGTGVAAGGCLVSDIVLSSFVDGDHLYCGIP